MCRVCKRILACGLALLMLVGLGGCAPAFSRHSVTYLDAFDTVSAITVYGIEQEKFTADVARLHDEMLRYHRLFDIYTQYEGLNNLKTVNDAQGQPVVVDEEILGLLEYGKQAYEQTDGRVNVVYGAVLSLWHECREKAMQDAQQAALPSAAALEEAARHTNPADLRIERAAGTVQLMDKQARLDVGAVAKGYAVERLAAFAMEELGWQHALLDIGGNVRAIGGKPAVGGEKPYVIGIRNPDTASAKTYLLKVAVTDEAVVTSGDYQRYYEVDGHRYHHIIDTQTRYPAQQVQAVTVICADSGLGDVLSTALFILPVEQGEKLLEQVDEAEAVWVLPDGTLHYSSGFEEYRVN